MDWLPWCVPAIHQHSCVMNLLLYSSHQHCVTCWCSGYTTTVRPVVIPAIIHCWEVSSLQASTIQNQCDLACSNSRTSYEIQCSSHALLWLLDPPVCKCLSSQHTLWDPMPAPAIIHIMWYYYYQQHQQGGTNKIALTFSDDTMTLTLLDDCMKWHALNQKMRALSGFPLFLFHALLFVIMIMNV